MEIRPLEVLLWIIAVACLVLTHIINSIKPVMLWDELLYVVTVVGITLVIISKVVYEWLPSPLPEPDWLDIVEINPFADLHASQVALPAPRPVRRAASPTPNLTGYVYLMRIATGYYKIGMSRKPESRLDGLSTGLPYDIELIHTIKCRDMSKIEKYFQDKFAHKRIKGEWFALDPEDVEYFRVFTEA